MPEGLEHEAVQETLLGDAMEHAGIGVLVWNEERRYVAANPRACRLIGAERADVLARRVGDNNRAAEAQDTVERLVRNVPARGRTPITHADGTQIELEWVVFPTRLAGLPHIVGLLWDAAELP